MPKIIPALTDTAIKQTKAADKPQRMFDGKQIGLHLLIQPSGAKLWRLRYTINSEEKRIALGKYPELKLEEARVKAGEFKKQIRHGVRLCYRYIDNRPGQFKYCEALAANLPVCSGEVESAHRYVIRINSQC